MNLRPWTLFFIACFTLFLLSCGSQSNSENQKNENSDATLAELNNKIANDPQNVALYVERANYYGGKENFQLAFDDLARAKQIDSTHAPIYASEGKFHFAQKRVQDAYRDYQR